MQKRDAAAAVMLIVNITPDSFSDGGVYADNLAKVMGKVEEALADDVTIFDIGAESTRPNATDVSIEEEISRLKPVIAALTELKNLKPFIISLDSYKPEVIKYFLSQIDIVNDVSNKLPVALVKQIIDMNKKYVLMHSLTIPANPAIVIENKDATMELLDWFSQKLDEYKQHKINLSNVILDLGIGFNKTAEQSWQLVREVEKFKQFGCEILIGHSRKRFLDCVTTKQFANRDLETALVSNHLYDSGIDYIRMHEYREFLLINKVVDELNEQ